MCLETIRGRLIKGRVLEFDELNYQGFPGETLALKEVFGFDKCRLLSSPYSSLKSYMVID